MSIAQELTRAVGLDETTAYGGGVYQATSVKQIVPLIAKQLAWKGESALQYREKLEPEFNASQESGRKKLGKLILAALNKILAKAGAKKKVQKLDWRKFPKPDKGLVVWDIETPTGSPMGYKAEETELTEISLAGKAPVKVWLVLLSGKLTQYDQRVSKRESKRGRVNIYRLGHLLKAKQQVEKATKRIENNDDPASLKKLKKALDKYFIPGALSPVEFVKKGIDQYIATGKLPKYGGRGGTAAWGY
jgi:DNA repair exonuclease SbcCD ATPase subunit